MLTETHGVWHALLGNLTWAALPFVRAWRDPSLSEIIGAGAGGMVIGAKIGPGRDIGCEVCAFAARWRGAGEPWGVGR